MQYNSFLQRWCWFSAGKYLWPFFTREVHLQALAWTCVDGRKYYGKQIVAVGTKYFVSEIVLSEEKENWWVNAKRFPPPK